MDGESCSIIIKGVSLGMLSVDVQASIIMISKVLLYIVMITYFALTDPDSGTAYNGQVQLYDDSDTGRRALLRVHFNGEWLPLCTSYLSNVSANSVCRQMGFTHSSQPPISSR